MFSNKMPYVFLDFDGVCTACDATPGSYITNRGKNYGATERCMRLLEGLLLKTGAIVIISSNWRRFGKDGVWRTSAFGEVKNPLPGLLGRLGESCKGAIPPIRHVAKPIALRAWFEENRLDPRECRYVIFDDDAGEGFAESEFADHFVMTDYSVGLTARDCEKAAAVLSA